MGFSQGGWVAPVVGTRAPQLVAFLINVSGPGVGVRATERYRLHRAAIDGGFDEGAILGFFQEAEAALSRGDVGQTVEQAAGVAGESWYPILEGLYETPEAAAFLAGILDFDPGPFFKELACPFLSCFGAADNLVPVDASVAALAPLLSRHSSSGLLVFPGADHGTSPGLIAMWRGEASSHPDSSLRSKGSCLASDQILLAEPGWAWAPRLK